VPLDLTTPIHFLKGVGPQRGAMLEAKRIYTVEDLLCYMPFRYEDRSNVKGIARLAPGEMATVMAEVRSARLAGFQRRGLGLFEAVFADGSGASLHGKWFHGGYLAKVLSPGLKVALFGKVEIDSYSGQLSMMHPEFEILSSEEEDAEASLHLGRIVPVYEGISKVNTRALRTLIHRALGTIPPPPDELPEALRERLRLPGRLEALRAAHFPEAGSDLRLLNAFRTPAQRRLIFEELFWLEFGLLLKRSQSAALPGFAFALHAGVREKIKQMLPFKPTAAQKRVLGEIARDMAAPRPMHRLLQGDVGSGKTIVAAQAAVIAIENGFQAVLLAPTEILAAQHYHHFKQILAPLGYVVTQLTGSYTSREKQQLKKLLSEGLAHVAIGTHALLEKDVEFKQLGLAIIDEQHRFGVLQRLGLLEKGKHPDVLVMTATPIPRTLSMTVYGDLDVSVIDEMPPGRKPVITKHVTEDQVERVYSFVKQQVERGRQAYVVYPVIEESEAMKAAVAMHEHLTKRVFPDLQVGLLHGRLPTEEREAAMEKFKRGETKILVSTTVIEVGVDVANASVMVVEQAERFGLAQLHQLRGRVGRGAEQSYCVLVTGKLGDVARERIRTLVDSSDGFRIAEMDLKLRGPGEFFGTKQSGLPSLRMANLLRDEDILEQARREAQEFLHPSEPNALAGDPGLAHPPSEGVLRRAIEYLQGNWQRRYGLVEAG
jgi:ATP-dependent DNA helicase RecG